MFNHITTSYDRQIGQATTEASLAEQASKQIQFQVLDALKL